MSSRASVSDVGAADSLPMLPGAYIALENTAERRIRRAGARSACEKPGGGVVTHERFLGPNRGEREMRPGMGEEARDLGGRA